MSFLARIDYKQVKKQKDVQILFLIWLFFSILTLFVFYFQIQLLSHVDVPTHIGAGLVIAAFIFSTVKVRSGREALALAFVPFLLWELIEIGISAGISNPFLFRLFEETRWNQIQDVSMDTLGFLVFLIMSGRRF